MHELLDLVDAREGHFRLESGHHGGMWLNLEPLFVAQERIRPFVVELAEKIRRHGVEAVCGPLVGGAFLAQGVAAALGVEFYYAERFAPPQREGLFPVEYRLPAGVRELARGKAVAIVDDAISAGSAVRGTLANLEAHGARVVAIGALLVLGGAAARLCAERGIALECVEQVAYDVWLPAECPLCASGVPLEDAPVG